MRQLYTHAHNMTHDIMRTKPLKKVKVNNMLPSNFDYLPEYWDDISKQELSLPYEEVPL